jgi:hypothetical protein
MGKRKFVKNGEKPVAYQCCRRTCKWEGLFSEKLIIPKPNDAIMSIYVCPKCGHDTFYGLVEVPIKK